MPARQALVPLNDVLGNIGGTREMTGMNEIFEQNPPGQLILMPITIPIINEVNNWCKKSGLL